MFELTEEEDEILRCQIGTSSWGGSRILPFVFTELGVSMLSSVLRSKNLEKYMNQTLETLIYTVNRNKYRFPEDFMFELTNKASLFDSMNYQGF